MNESYFLTADDVRAIRNATSVCFDRNSDGTSQIRAIRESGPYASVRSESVVTIPVEGRLENYGDPVENFSAFHMESSAQFDRDWQTIAHAIKPGHRIVLRWVRDNNSPVLRTAGLIADDLHLSTGKDDGRRADTFLVCRSVGLDNSARMIRSAPLSSLA